MSKKKQTTILLICLGSLLLIFEGLKVVGIINNATQKDNKDATYVDDYIEYFDITKIVDNLYNAISEGNSEYLMNVYSQKYIDNNKLDKSNIVKHFNPDEYFLREYVINLYKHCNKNNCYYFVETEGQKTDYDGGVYRKDDKKYLIIIGDLSNKTYSVTPLNNVNNYEEYIKNYEYQSVSIKENADNKFSSSNVINDKEIISYYLGYVEYLLILDNTKANQFIENYNYNHRIDYLMKLENTLYSYSKDTKKQEITYEGMLYDSSLFSIKTTAPMKFVIAFE